MTEIQFGLRSGNIARIQSNSSITGRTTLTSEEYKELIKLTQSQSFIDYIGAMSCPDPVKNDGYKVTLTVDVYDGEDQRYIKDVTGCYDNGQDEDIDVVTTYAESIFMTYYR